MGYTPMFASELEFYLYKESYAEAHEQDYRDLTPTIPYILDYHILATTMDEQYLGRSAAACRAPGSRSSSRRARPGTASTRSTRATPTRSPPPTATRSTRTASRRSRSCNGISATFMAKPSEKDIGSSCHIHSSLVDARRAPAPLSTAARRPTCFATTSAGCAPHPRAGAVRRPVDQLLQALRGRELGADLDLVGRDNRTCGFRVVGHGQSRRAECRIPGADANPYLGLRGAARRRARRDRATRPIPARS